MVQRLSRETLTKVEEWYKAQAMCPDAEQHFNHAECPAGTDRRQRLYTRLTEDRSKVLCHCFNCGGSGFVKLGAMSILQKDTVSLDTLMKDVISHGEKAEKWDTFSRIYGGAAKLSSEKPTLGWPHSSILSEAERFWMDQHDWYGMRYSDGIGYITPRGETGFDIRDRCKRMQRITKPGHEGDSKLLVYNTKNSDTAVICEDAISAMKIDMCGYAGVALCSSTLSQDDAFKLSMRFRRFIVWLDNDNDTVKEHAKLAYDRLRLYSDWVVINKGDSDPKKYSAFSLRFSIEKFLDAMLNNSNKD